jgi:hypothetical protein
VSHHGRPENLRLGGVLADFGLSADAFDFRLAAAHRRRDQGRLRHPAADCPAANRQPTGLRSTSARARLGCYPLSFGSRTAPGAPQSPAQLHAMAVHSQQDTAALPARLPSGRPGMTILPMTSTTARSRTASLPD